MHKVFKILKKETKNKELTQQQMEAKIFLAAHPYKRITEDVEHHIVMLRRLFERDHGDMNSLYHY